jgi:hypothetical protein
LQTFLQIVDKDVHRLNAEIKVLLLLVSRGFRAGWRQWIHRRDYKSGRRVLPDAIAKEIM